MSKYLIVVPPFFGHINPTLGIGAELLCRGHQVVWVGLKEIKKNLIPDGGIFLVPKDLESKKHEIDNILQIQDLGVKIRGVDIIRFVMETTYVPFCEILVDALLKLIDEVRPDVLIHDENMFAGAICALLKNIPYVTSIAVPPGSFQPEGLFENFEKWQTEQIIRLQKKFGIASDKKKVYSPKLNLVYTSREFADNSHKFPEHYKFVGPIVKGRKKMAEFNFKKLEERKFPVVYVSLGTLLHSIRKEFFSKIVAALADEPLTVVVATHPDVIDSWPDNFIVQEFVPQAELLPYVDAVIYHGGFNTVNEALLHGLPMLIIPMAYDQFQIASMVTKPGAGLSIRYKRLKIDALRDSLWELLNNAKYKVAAQRMGDTLKNSGGTEAAAGFLEEFAKCSYETEGHMIEKFKQQFN